MLCHPGLLECTVCNDLGSLYAIQDCWNAAIVSIFISICNDLGWFYVIQDSWNAAFVSIFTSICNDQGSFHVIQDSWNAAFVSIFSSICNDQGSFYVIQDSWNATFVSIFTSICNDVQGFVYLWRAPWCDGRCLRGPGQASFLRKSATCEPHLADSPRIAADSRRAQRSPVGRFGVFTAARLSSQAVMNTGLRECSISIDFYKHM